MKAYIADRDTISDICSKCGMVLSAVTGVATDRPFDKPVKLKGHVSICVYCFHITIFTDDEGHRRDVTRVEFEAIMKIPEIVDVMRKVQAGMNTSKIQ
jgi:hypothetical protein